jgi:glycosyltransferase involved in cell wall biosynthesis
MPGEQVPGCKAENANPRLAILVLAYNHGNYIEQCLSSLITIDFPDVHIWVLDDGSDDLTADIVRRMGALHGGITLLTQTNSKGKTAQNLQRLTDASTGRYLMFMAGDDMLGPAFPARTMIQYLEDNPLTGLVLPRCMPFNQSPMLNTRTPYDASFLEILHSGDPQRVCCDHLQKAVSAIFLQGMILRRALVEEAGGFDVELAADDYAFMLRIFPLMQSKGYRFKFNPDGIWLYRIHDNNVHKNAVRQITLISETVGKYIPAQFWRDFHWHSPPVPHAEDLRGVEQVLIKNLNEDQAARLMNEIVKKSFQLWCSTKRYSEIRKVFADRAMTLISTHRLIFLLTQALPFILVSPILRLPYISVILQRLADLERRG